MGKPPSVDPGGFQLESDVRGVRRACRRSVSGRRPASQPERRCRCALPIPSRSTPPRSAGAPARICTSHVERQNLTVRMGMRRFTRLTNGFSKTWKGLRAALALHFAHYNLVRFHSSIRMTPAMKAGVTRKPWSLADLLVA